MIEYWIDIPNLQTVNLPYLFKKAESKSITSICMNMNEWTDVSPILADSIPFKISSIDKNSTSICIPNGSYNDTNCISFDFSQYISVESITIGDDCFSNVKVFLIDGLNHLKSIKIGKNSFTRITNSDEYDQSKSFQIKNCSLLVSIEIGEYSFYDYGGKFELKNLRSLTSLKIGVIGSTSRNFRYSSFSIESRSFECYSE